MMMMMYRNSLSLLCCLALVALMSRADTHDETNAENGVGDRQLQSECSDFYYNAKMEMKFFDPSDCSDTELDDIETEIATAFKTVTDIDPLLRDVESLVMEFCPTQMKRRRLNWWGARWSQNPVGACRFCGSNSNSYHRNRLLGKEMEETGGRIPFIKQVEAHQSRDSRKANMRKQTDENHRALTVGKVTGLSLYNTDDENNATFIKTIEHADVIDLQEYGHKLTILAETEGEIGSVRFSLDSTTDFKMENRAVYALNGNRFEQINTCEELSTVGTHTITATPSGDRWGGGEQGSPVTRSILVVDGSTNAVNAAAPGSTQQLIYLLEDDLSFYISGLINAAFFGRPGHCLENDLMYVDVGLSIVSKDHLTCQSFTDPDDVFGES